jgi:hypothetical protein
LMVPSSTSRLSFLSGDFRLRLPSPAAVPTLTLVCPSLLVADAMAPAGGVADGVDLLPAVTVPGRMSTDQDLILCPVHDHLLQHQARQVVIGIGAALEIHSPRHQDRDHLPRQGERRVRGWTVTGTAVEAAPALVVEAEAVAGAGVSFGGRLS